MVRAQHLRDRKACLPLSDALTGSRGQCPPARIDEILRGPLHSVSVEIVEASACVGDHVDQNPASSESGRARGRDAQPEEAGVGTSSSIFFVGERRGHGRLCRQARFVESSTSMRGAASARARQPRPSRLAEQRYSRVTST